MSVTFNQVSPTNDHTSGDIINRMNKLMLDLEAVAKSSKNTQQGFNFRGIDTMLNVFKPLFAKHGIVMTTQTLNHTTELREVVRSNGKAGIDKHVSLLQRYNFHSVGDGSLVSTTVAAEGIDSGDKATTKALSMALKYALIQTFTVPTEDIDDGDSDSPEIAPKKVVTSATVAQSQPAQSAASTPQATAPASSGSQTVSQSSTSSQPSTTNRAKFQRGNTMSQWSK